MTETDTEKMAQALRIIRQHVAADPSAVAASIIATCDEALLSHASARAQPASVADHLSRAAEPVVFRWLTPMGNGFVWTRWCDAEGQQPPADRKVEYAYTHPSEDARDLDAKDANRFRFWCGRTQCDLDHWRREIDDAMKESGNGQ